MIEVWKQWEGEVINGEFHLRQYLGGSDPRQPPVSAYTEKGHRVRVP